MKLFELCKPFLDRVSTGESTVFVIEAAYLDLREPAALDRFEHFKLAIALASELLECNELAPLELRVSYLLNDLTRPKSEKLQPNEVTQIWCDTLEKLIKNRIAVAESTKTILGFTMRKTKKNALKTIGSLLKNQPDAWHSHEKSKMEEVTVSVDDTDISIAKKANKSTRIVPNCVALMAQHYLDICRRVCESTNPAQIVIFDFSRFSEAGNVLLGGEIAPQFAKWPKDLTAYVASFVTDSNLESCRLSTSKLCCRDTC